MSIISPNAKFLCLPISIAIFAAALIANFPIFSLHTLSVLKMVLYWVVSISAISGALIGGCVLLHKFPLVAGWTAASAFLLALLYAAGLLWYEIILGLPVGPRGTLVSISSLGAIAFLLSEMFVTYCLCVHVLAQSWNVSQMPKGGSWWFGFVIAGAVALVTAIVIDVAYRT